MILPVAVPGIMVAAFFSFVVSWGDYLIEICAELMEDYAIAGFSFDGNYHPAICYCPACRKAYRAERGRVRRRPADDLRRRRHRSWPRSVPG